MCTVSHASTTRGHGHRGDQHLLHLADLLGLDQREHDADEADEGGRQDRQRGRRPRVVLHARLGLRVRRVERQHDDGHPDQLGQRPGVEAGQHGQLPRSEDHRRRRRRRRRSRRPARLAGAPASTARTPGSSATRVRSGRDEASSSSTTTAPSRTQADEVQLDRPPLDGIAEVRRAGARPVDDALVDELVERPRPVEHGQQPLVATVDHRGERVELADELVAAGRRRPCGGT